jgi:hypothetical protein
MTWWRRWSKSDDGDGAVGLPLASAPSGISTVLGFVGHCLAVANVGLSAPACPSFIMTLREGGPWSRTAGAPIRAWD